MSDDAKTGLNALLMLASLITGAVVGHLIDGSNGTVIGLLVVAAVWAGVAVNSVLTSLRRVERSPRISRQRHRANIETLAARVVMDVEEAV